jgi:class 3 adenylate cyclase/tetratricopeptide (TPR) repeat protein
MKFCGQCGIRLGQTCQNCGFVNPPEHRFCGQCGTRLEEQPVPAVPAELTKTEPVSSPRVEMPDVAPVQLEGERRLATVILVDVAQSTDLLERIGTEKWVQIMNRVLQTLEAEVYRFGGTVDQFRGDGLVAFFGADAAHEDDPERAVLAGLAMHRAIEPYATELAEQDGIALTLRVGVNTGELIVASIGDRRHYAEDTAMGEAIALAARMETAAEPGTVLVSDNTYHLVETYFDWLPLGMIIVKGISQPVPVFRPLTCRAHAAPERHWQPYDPFALLTGRETEFDALKENVDALRSDRGGVVFLVGDTGMGKSALVGHAHQYAVRQDAVLTEAESAGRAEAIGVTRSLTWLQARCRSYDQSRPYSMWLDLFEGWLDVCEEEPQTETSVRLRRQVEALWGEQAAEKAAEHYPYMATFLSLPQEYALPEFAKHLDAGARRQQNFEAVRSWIVALVKRGPLVLAFDNVHWADASSLELLEFCLPLCREYPLLCLIALRPDPATSAWKLKRRVEEEYDRSVTPLALFPLTDAQGDKMIDRLIGPHVVPDETRALLRQRAEGNPYYIEEFIHALIREGVLVRDAATDQWRATRTIDSLDLPNSLQNLLLARIDTLNQDERRVLRMAAVIGPVFWSNLLESMACDGSQLVPHPLDTQELSEHLAALQRAQLVKERGHVLHLGAEYNFESNLVRDTAYDGLLSTQRVNWHRCVADTLEQIFGEKVLARYYSLLAFHYRRAGATRKELFYTLLAAEEALEDRANVEALEHYNRALELLDAVEAEAQDERQVYAICTQRFEVLNGRRQVFFVMGDYEAGWADAKALLPLARRLRDDPVWLIDALLQQPGVSFIGSKEDAAAGASQAQEALALSREIGDRRREMQSLAAIASQGYFRHDPDWVEVSEQALQMARELGDRRYEVGILTSLGGALAFSDPDRSKQYLQVAMPIAQDLGDKMAELELLDVVGMQMETSVDYYRRLTECHERQLAISRDVGNPQAEARPLMFAGQIQSIYLGDYEGGMALLERSRYLSEGNPFELYSLLRIAQIWVEQERYDETSTVLERASRIAEEQLHVFGRVGLRMVWAIFCNRQGGKELLQKALTLTSEAVELSTDNPQLGDQYRMAALCEATAAHLALASLETDEARRHDHVLEAMKSSHAALVIYETDGFVRPVECVSEEIFFRRSLALGANGHTAEQAEYARRAHAEMMRKVDLIPEDSGYRQTYLENIPLHREIRAAVRGAG